MSTTHQSDTARLSASPDFFAEEHPDLLPTEPRDAPIASSSRDRGGSSGMHGAMSARYDKTTKLATGTTMEEYRRLNMQVRATTVGMWGGVIAGGFIISGSLLSYIISQSMLQSRLSEVVAQAKDAALPRDPMGGGLMIMDNAHTDHSSDLIKSKSDEEVMKDELRNLGRDRRRTRWGKGRGLEGEVEEEPELRDTFFRPGVPRREV